MMAENRHDVDRYRELNVYSHNCYYKSHSYHAQGKVYGMGDNAAMVRRRAWRILFAFLVAPVAAPFAYVFLFSIFVPDTTVMRLFTLIAVPNCAAIRSSKLAIGPNAGGRLAPPA